MREVFSNLFHGRYSAWERKPYRTDENKAVNRKIEDEKRYFSLKMSLDDFQRLQALENLYNEASDFEQMDAFTYGFRLGTTLMCAVFMDENELTHD
jgi:hypothetical protein